MYNYNFYPLLYLDAKIKTRNWEESSERIGFENEEATEGHKKLRNKETQNLYSFANVVTLIMSLSMERAGQVVRIRELLSMIDTDRIKNYMSNNSSIVACVFVATVTFFLLSLCLATIVCTHTDTQTGGRNLWSTHLRWAQAPWYTYQVS
jgi:hypothetical protein